MSEEWYDKEIAPALLELGRKCESRGVSFLAVVEYERGQRGRTGTIAVDAGLEMRMLDLCAKSVPNVDAYIIALIRYCREHGVNTDASFVLNRLSKI